MNKTLELSNVTETLDDIVIKTLTSNNIIFNKYYKELKLVKNKITEYTLSWNNYKKYTNPYELIYSPYDNTNISNYNPISRSFFKMWEILDKFKLLKKNENYLISNIAEGPGGFIESILKYRQNDKDKFISNTLKPNNKSIPSWYKLTNMIKLNNVKNIFLNYCNLFDRSDFNNFISLFEDKKADLITGDGGFDYSKNFNTQEEQSYKIIYSEIVMALSIQNLEGSFILKIFDCFTIFTLKCIYLLLYFYETVYIYKPLTSRIANSEKYIICKNFKGINSDLKQNLLESLHHLKDGYLDISNIKIPNDFIYKLDSFNQEIISQQSNNIEETINLIKNKNDVNKYKSKQIELAKKWCKIFNFNNIK